MREGDSRRITTKEKELIPKRTQGSEKSGDIPIRHDCK